MQWICNIALFLVLSGILLEMISDTKYYKFARWVAGVILLLQFFKPLTDSGDIKSRFTAIFSSFDYALGTDRVLEEIYEINGRTENSVLAAYKETVAEQIGRMLQKNGLRLAGMELSVAEDGTMEFMQIWAVYEDGKEQGNILIPTVIPVRLGETPKKETVSPMELYIRETLAEFYQIEENKIEVVIQEAE